MITIGNVYRSPNESKAQKIILQTAIVMEVTFRLNTNTFQYYSTHSNIY